MSQCPCGSNIDLAACCGRYHAGTPAPTAEALMRSRYAAYATGNLGYIEATCAGPAALAFEKAEAEISQLGMRWLGLEIVATTRGRESDSEGTVSFVARYRHNGEEAEHTETSEFRRLDGVWSYWGRAANSLSHRAASVGRNDPCPCGSGKKYKKCCGVDG